MQNPTHNSWQSLWRKLFSGRNVCRKEEYCGSPCSANWQWYLAYFATRSPGCSAGPSWWSLDVREGRAECGVRTSGSRGCHPPRSAPQREESGPWPPSRLTTHDRAPCARRRGTGIAHSSIAPECCDASCVLAVEKGLRIVGGRKHVDRFGIQFFKLNSISHGKQRFKMQVQPKTHSTERTFGRKVCEKKRKAAGKRIQKAECFPKGDTEKAVCLKLK